MGRVPNNHSIKPVVIALIESLPDDCTLADIQYTLYVEQNIEEGLADADAGKLISHVEAKRRMRKRLQKKC